MAPVASTALELTRIGFDVVELLTLLGAGLRELHSVPVEGCPFDAGNEALLDRAEHAVAADAVDGSRFDRAYQRSTPAELLDIVTSSRPTDPDVSVLVHGAACLEVVRVDGGRVIGWSSLARSGRGDAYRDLATMATDLVAVIGPEALGPFIDAYGLEHPDVLRLDWHVMVDQLVR